ncbi:MAG: hypothetical protein KME30_26150 [Iphinoe sp. HA4291-MV1]|nr:hypothetical protein [Iphinoe sp. HA4291-MV1]
MDFGLQQGQTYTYHFYYQFYDILELNENFRYRILSDNDMTITIIFENEWEAENCFALQINRYNKDPYKEGKHRTIIRTHKNREQAIIDKWNQLLTDPRFKTPLDPKAFNHFNSINYHGESYYDENGYYICNPIDEVENKYSVKIPLTKEEAEQICY